MMIEVVGESRMSEDGYIITVAEEIRRVLMTRKGSIPMNPEYGSDLYLYRDRQLDNDTRLSIIAETFDAIERSVRRAQPTRVGFTMPADGKFGLRIEIARRDDDTAA